MSNAHRQTPPLNNTISKITPSSGSAQVSSVPSIANAQPYSFTSILVLRFIVLIPIAGGELGEEWDGNRCRRPVALWKLPGAFVISLHPSRRQGNGTRYHIHRLNQSGSKNSDIFISIRQTQIWSLSLGCATNGNLIAHQYLF
jgi:hypothetical protein